MSTVAVTAPTKLSIWRALNRAIHDAMEEDPSVFLMGEDITTWGTGGGIYGVTRGLADGFGHERVRNTPISEEAIVAAAVGAAMRGTRPIVEIMYSDFSLLAMDAIVNQAAKAHYMFGGQFSVPMVLRSNGGSGLGKGAQHSQSLESIFAHIPGLEVVVPSDANDAYGLFRTAVRSANPTIFLEHKALYNERGVVSFEAIPFGQARVVREGTDATVVATQLVLHRVVAAAEILKEESADIEIIDPRTLFPLDMETILRSVEKTGRILVAHEAPRSFGFGAEILAEVAETFGQQLRAAPVRIGGCRSPIPYAEPLEQAVIPDVNTIVSALRRLTGT